MLTPDPRDDPGVSESGRGAGPVDRAAGKLGADKYLPGTALDEGMIGLHTNESPFEPSQRALDAIGEVLRGIRLYPDPSATSLRKALANHHGVGVENVLVGAGGDGVLDAIFRSQVHSGDVVALTDPTYIVLRQLCRIYGAEPVSAPWPQFSSMKSQGATLTCVVNPNSPSGEWVPPEQLEGLLPDADGLLVIDEAYAPFANDSMIPRLSAHPSWVVVRSFSKAYALAGLRIGYMIGAPDVVQEIALTQLPYPISSLALSAAEAALSDENHLARSVTHIRMERTRLSDSLASFGWDVGSSKGNFIWVKPPFGHAEVWRQRFWDNGVAVRMFPSIDRERLRIAISSAANSDAVIAIVAAAQ